MYYGEAERLCEDPLTIYSFDRPETAYDDRFVVVHLIKQDKSDETDLTGDVNQNGYIDIYRRIYSSNLWNTDCVIAIDTDNELSNNGIIDFLAYSNQDETIHAAMENNVRQAQSFGEWQNCSNEMLKECMLDIGKSGLLSYMSIARKNLYDSNTKDDFAITKFATPGRDNIISSSILAKRRLFRVFKKRITIIPSHPDLGKGEIKIFVYEPCNIRFRVFSFLGILIYESPLFRDVYPGDFILQWNPFDYNRRAGTGLYIGYIEATSRRLKKFDVENIFLILSRYR